MSWNRVRHTLNGKLLGIYYETEGGNRVYLGHRTLRHLNTRFNGWSIDVGTLNRCRERGFMHVGIVCRRAGAKHIWITDLEDFFHPAKSFTTRTKIGVERGVRLTNFKVDPANDFNKINTALKIG